MSPPEPGRAYFPAVETHLLPSRYVAQTFRIQVAQPERLRGAAPVPAPVIYATDANRAFEMLNGVSQIIQAAGYDAPPYILVGIGYPTDAPRGGVVLRVRDFTFPGYPDLPLRPPPVEGVLVAEPGTPQIHGADAFLDFIEHELKPFIESRYATLPSETVYFGHSGGGGLGVYSLLTRPGLFRGVIASSPSLYLVTETDGAEQGHDLLAGYIDRFLVNARPTSAPLALYLSVGAAEEHEPGMGRWRLCSSLERLVQRLREAAVSGLTVHAEVLEGETHMTAWPIAFIHGVQAVFGCGRWRVPETDVV